MENFRMFDSIAEICGAARAAWPKYRNNDRYGINESRDKWAGGTMDEAQNLAQNGDLTRVASSDALLTKFETLTFDTHRPIMRDDVCGSVANVPAYLAGHPLNMRRRDRAEDSRAPICIFMDLFATCSYSPDEIAKRGAAVMALARILTTVRPVELYAGCASYTNGRQPCGVAFRIETAPLDLGRAAYVLCASAFLRRPIFTMVYEMRAQNGIPPFQGEYAKEIGPRLFPHASTMLFVRGLDATQIAANPQAWIIDQIRAAAPEMLNDEA